MLQQGLNRLAGVAEFGKTPPAFADGASKRVTEDGWIGPETIAAAEKHAAENGLARVRAAVALWAKRLAAVASLSLCSFALGGCFFFRHQNEGDPYVKGNLFDEAIWFQTLGDGEGIARQIPMNIAPLLGADSSMDAIQELLAKHGAKCERDRTSVICRYGKTRLRGKMADILTRYDVEVVARPGKTRKTILTVCVDGSVSRACVESELK